MVKRTPRPNGGYTLHDNKGFAGSIGPGAKAPRVMKTVLVEDTEESVIEQNITKTSSSGMISFTTEQLDDAKGTDAPALSVSLPDGNRLYAVHPKYISEIMANPEKALEDGKAYPSITTVGKIVDKPALKEWAVAMAARESVKHFKELDQDLQSNNIVEAKEKLSSLLKTSHHSGTQIENIMKTASTDAATRAAERGTNVHAILESLARGDSPDIPAEYVGYVRAYEQFRTRFPEMEMVHTEVTVINDEYGYAGTADGIVKIKDKYYVIDYKTNKNGSISDDVGLQLAAVANATHIVHPDGSRTPLAKISGGIGVGLAPNGKLSVVPFKTDNYFPDFTNALGLWYSRRKGRDTVKTNQVHAGSIADIINNT